MRDLTFFSKALQRNMPYRAVMWWTLRCLQRGRKHS